MAKTLGEDQSLGKDKMESLTPDGGVQKRIEVPGEGDRPQANAKVYVVYTVKHVGGRVIESSRQWHEEFTFRIGKEQVIPGLEIILRSMRPGELATGKLSGNYTLKRQGITHPVEVEVKLVRVETAEAQKGLMWMTPTERLEYATSCKEKGNGFFKEAKYSKAVKEYRLAEDCLELVFNDAKAYEGLLGKARGDATPGKELSQEEQENADAEKQQLQEMVDKVRVSTFNNLALCYMKEGNNLNVIKYTNKVLDVDPDNAKALYYRGLARTNTGDTESAKADLQRAALLNPTDARVRIELDRIEKKIVSDRKREKRAYGAMFSSAQA